MSPPIRVVAAIRCNHLWYHCGDICQATTAFEMGWAEFSNGDLLLEAEAQFNALVTTDQNLRYQQNLANRRLAILVLPFASWPKLERHKSKIVAAIEGSAAWRLP